MPSDTEPRIDTQQTADGAAAVLRGEWTAARLTAGKTWRGISAALGATGTAAAWDLRGLDALDHLGALTLWNHWGQQWPARLEVDDGQRALLERVAAYPAVAPARKRLGWAQRVDALGVRVLQSAAQVRDFVTLMGQLLLDFLRLLGRPDKGPWRDFSGNLFSIGAKALYQICAKLQKALEEERTDEIGALRDAFDSLLSGLLKEISGIEPENVGDNT